MRTNNRTNSQIKGVVVVVDFLLLNILLLLYSHFSPLMTGWEATRIRIFFITLNVALLIGQFYRSTIIHLRNITLEDIAKRVLGLAIITIVLAYVMMKGISLSNTKVGMQLVTFGIGWTICLFISRYVERQIVKSYRKMGRNTRMVTLVGSDPELVGVLRRLRNDATLGYQVIGYYGDEHLEKLVDEIEEAENNKKNYKKDSVRLKRLGSYEDLLDAIKKDEELDLGDELYMCVSRLDRDRIREVSKFCDQHVVRFFYVPVSVETIGLNLKREMVDDNC